MFGCCWIYRWLHLYIEKIAFPQKMNFVFLQRPFNKMALVWKDLFKLVSITYHCDDCKKRDLYNFLRLIISVRRDASGNKTFSRKFNDAIRDPLFYDKMQKYMHREKVHSLLDDLRLATQTPFKHTSVPIVNNVHLRILFGIKAQVEFTYNGKEYMVVGHLAEKKSLS